MCCEIVFLNQDMKNEWTKILRLAPIYVGPAMSYFKIFCPEWQEKLPCAAIQ